LLSVSRLYQLGHHLQGSQAYFKEFNRKKNHPKLR
jgi:hypothetical protein